MKLELEIYVNFRRGKSSIKLKSKIFDKWKNIKAFFIQHYSEFLKKIIIFILYNMYKTYGVFD